MTSVSHFVAPIHHGITRALSVLAVLRRCSTQHVADGTRIRHPIIKEVVNMWYLAWFLAILLACACAIILGVWLENTHLPPEPPQANPPS